MVAIDRLADALKRVPEDLMGAFLATLPEDEAQAVVRAHLSRAEGWQPLPHQIPPDVTDDWVTWLLFGGRGTGKTDASAAFVTDHVHGPPCDDRLPGGHRIAIIAPTLGDAVESCVNGPSGLKAHDPTVKLTGGAGGAMVRWHSGAEGKLFGAHSPDDVERLRAGGNRCLVWVEELAAWRQLDGAWDNMTFGLRLGHRPRIVGSTTPRPRKLLKQIIDDPLTRVSHGKTSDNPHLDPRVRARLEARYAGTRLGRQELEGEMLEDVEGALWEREWIEKYRVDEMPTGLTRIVVAVDPAVTNTEDSDETGLIAAGRTKPRLCPVCGPVEVAHAFVIADRTTRDTPDGWARRAIKLYDDVSADRLIAEVNQGYDLVETVIRNVRPGISYEKVTAKRGKALRAQPVSAVYQQGRVHHVGRYDELEDQQCTWDPDSGDDSPDRLDALVYAITALGLVHFGEVKTSAPKNRPEQRTMPQMPLERPGARKQPRQGARSGFPKVGFPNPRSARR